MARDFEMRLDTSEFDRMVRESPRLAEIASSRALNRGIKKSRTSAIRRAAKDVGIPQKAIRKRAFLRKATRRRLNALLTIIAKPINPAVLRSTRQTGKPGRPPHGRKGGGVKASKGRFWKSAFIPTRGEVGSHLVALGAIRPTKNVVLRRTTKKRYPLEVIKIPIRDEVERAVQTSALKEGRQVFERELPRQMELLMRAAAKGTGVSVGVA